MTINLSSINNTQSINTIFSKDSNIKKLFNNNPVALKNLDHSLLEFGKFSKSISKLPLPILQFILAGSFGSGIAQTIQEALMQLTPKAGVNGIIRQSGLVVADEAAFELLEYAAIYFFPTILAIALAQVTNQISGKAFPHFELLGKRIYDLEKNLGKDMIVGTLKPKTVKLKTPEIINKIGYAKFFNILTVIGSTIAAEIIAGGIRPQLIEKIFGTSNFYKISGLEDDPEHDKDGETALLQARKNIKDALKAIAIIIPSLLGLQVLGRAAKLDKLPIFKNIVRHVDLGNKFELSRTILILTLIPGAAYGFNTTVRGMSEGIENLFRMLFFSWPAIVFFKQTFGTFLTWGAGHAMGAGNVIGNPAKTWWHRTFGKEKGKKDIFDLGLADIGTKEPVGQILAPFKHMGNLFAGKDSGVEYTGAIADKINAMDNIDTKRKRKIMQTLHFTKEHAPVYLFALPIGTAFAWWNYQRTQKLLQNDRKDSSEQNVKVNHDNKMIAYLEGVATDAAKYFYNIQQANFGKLANNNKTGLTTSSFPLIQQAA